MGIQVKVTVFILANKKAHEIHFVGEIVRC